MAGASVLTSAPVRAALTLRYPDGLPLPEVAAGEGAEPRSTYPSPSCSPTPVRTALARYKAV